PSIAVRWIRARQRWPPTRARAPPSCAPPAVSMPRHAKSTPANSVPRRSPRRPGRRKPMSRYTNAILALGVLAAAAAVYDMKHDAERSAEHVAALQRQIEDERAQLQMLRAEWSLLNDPSRLQRLVERYN